MSGIPDYQEHLLNTQCCSYTVAPSKAMGISLGEVEEAIKEKMKPNLVDMNVKALNLGAKYVGEIK